MAEHLEITSAAIPNPPGRLWLRDDNRLDDWTRWCACGAPFVRIESRQMVHTGPDDRFYYKGSDELRVECAGGHMSVPVEGLRRPARSGPLESAEQIYEFRVARDG